MGLQYSLGVLAIAIGIVAYGVYIRQTLKHGVQPHPVSWGLWGIITLVAYLVQNSKEGGAGSWVTLFTAIVCILIAFLTSLKYGWRFSKFDVVFAGATLFVVYVYAIERDPTMAAIWATVADVLGYAPTIKKGWFQPHKDSAWSFFLNGVKFAPAVLAMVKLSSLSAMRTSWSLATCLYPTTLVVVNMAVAFFLLERRRELGLPVFGMKREMVERHPNSGDAL